MRKTPKASRSYNGIGNDKRERGTVKTHTIKILGIGRSNMEVIQTQRNSLTGKADGGRSESIISGRSSIVYSTPLIKYRETEGIKVFNYFNS